MERTFPGDIAKRLEIGLATAADIDGIDRLQLANQRAGGGWLSARLPPGRIAGMLSSMPLIVAREQDEIVAFLMTAKRETNVDIPIVRAMLDAYPGAPGAYIYGPICVAERMRGRGVAGAMVDFLRDCLPGREGILFIRRDNTASLRAHARAGMVELARFDFGGSEHAVFACRV